VWVPLSLTINLTFTVRNGGGVSEPGGPEIPGRHEEPPVFEQNAQQSGTGSAPSWPQAMHPAQWYRDPTGRFQFRYWDGQVWTSHVSTYGSSTLDPQPVVTLQGSPTTQVPRPARPRRRARIIGIGVVVALVAGAIIARANTSSGGSRSQGSLPPASAPAGSTTPGAASQWVRSDLKPVSQPYTAGGLFIVYVAVKSGLEVDGLDPMTGRTVWQDPASPADVTPALAPGLAQFDTGVVFYQNAGGGDAKMVGVDASTGRTDWTSNPGSFFDWPEVCDDDPTEVCTTGFIPADGGDDGLSRALRFHSSTGKRAGSVVISSAADGGGRSLGPSLYDPGHRNPELLEATSSRSVAWQVPLSKIFTSPGASTDNGWNFDLVPAVGLFVGSVFGPPLSSTSSRSLIDLTRTMTAGFTISDGETEWRDAGSSYACSFLPCPETTGSSSNASAPTPGVRLRMTGTATSTDSEDTASPDATVVVEGFDLATGKTVWSFDAGHDAGLIDGSPPAQVGDATVILPGVRGTPTQVDLSTGAQAPVPVGTVAWCHALTSYNEPTPFQPGNGSPIHDYSGGIAHFPCDVSGHPVAVPNQVPSFAATTIGGTAAWSEMSEVVAAPAGT
jgi:hypothetical protein